MTRHDSFERKHPLACKSGIKGWTTQKGWADMSDDAQYLAKLREENEKARQDLSNQTLKERTTVAGLLRVLKIPYEDGEIRKEGPEPIDVRFRNAGFQVTEIPDKDCRRDAEYREKQKKYNAATLPMELGKPVQRGHDSLDPTACAPEVYFELILSRSQKKVKKYGQVDGDIDLLVYINQQPTHLYPTEPWPDPAPLRQHGWRSVAFVGGGPYARVLYANKDAPDFLRKAVGKTHFWEQEQTMFPQTLGLQCEPEAKSARSRRSSDGESISFSTYNVGRNGEDRR